MSKSGLSASWSNDGLLMAELNLLTLPPARRKRAMSQIGREVQKQARLNVRKQRDVNGRLFEGRKKRRTKKGKMLSGFVKSKNMRQKASPNSVTIGLKNDLMARIAYEHQMGMKRKVRARRMSNAQKEAWKDDEATRKQAVAMNALGFRVAAKGGKKRRVSQSWIMKNLTKFQSLGILYTLKDGESSMSSWDTILPERRFFPNDAAWVRAMTIEVMTNEYRKGR